MSNTLRRGFLMAADIAYKYLARPLIFLLPAARAHRYLVRSLAFADRLAWSRPLLRAVRRMAFASDEVTVGGVRLGQRFMLAAGLVKGKGFMNETEALAAVRSGTNIIPGWNTLPHLLGPVEMGSFTRYPRPGNPGVVVWRDANTQTTQNRVGLTNPGACAAAAFLAKHAERLPDQFGINIAVSPGVDDPAQQMTEVIESLAAFVDAGLKPAWFTLNLSCPNTEDDPAGSQTEALALRMCGAAVDYLAAFEPIIPLWVKISPRLAPEQYAILMQSFAAVGVRAVIATNTLPQPAPDGSGQVAGVGGGGLQAAAVAAAARLIGAKNEHDYGVDVIGCGGVLDGASYRDYSRLGVKAVQYWSALVYRGPLAAAIIANEAA